NEWVLFSWHLINRANEHTLNHKTIFSLVTYNFLFGQFDFIQPGIAVGKSLTFRHAVGGIKQFRGMQVRISNKGHITARSDIERKNIKALLNRFHLWLGFSVGLDCAVNRLNTLASQKVDLTRFNPFNLFKLAF